MLKSIEEVSGLLLPQVNQIQDVPHIKGNPPRLDYSAHRGSYRPNAV